MWPRRDGLSLVCPNQHVTPATKIDQCTQKAGPDTHTKSALSSITLLAGLTQSTRMHRHANETRASAGHSDDACIQLHTPTHAAAPEVRFWRSGMHFRRCGGADNKDKART